MRSGTKNSENGTKNRDKRPGQSRARAPLLRRGCPDVPPGQTGGTNRTTSGQVNCTTQDNGQGQGQTPPGGVFIPVPVLGSQGKVDREYLERLSADPRFAQWALAGTSYWAENE